MWPTLVAGLLIAGGGGVAGGQTNAGSVAVGSSASVAVTVTLASAGTAASINVVTQGVANVDFSDGGGGTCATGMAYAAGATCTVMVTFAPQWPGTRMGAVVLRDSSGTSLGTAFLVGTGVGSQLGWLPLQPAYPLFQNCFTAGVATDAAGDFYVTCPQAGVTYKLTPSGGTWVATQVSFGLGTPNGLFDPEGIAVDGAGNVYVSDSVLNRVVKETPNGSGYVQTDVPATSLNIPKGLAVDGAGNLYIADWNSGRVLEETPTGNGYSEKMLARLDAPTGIAVDANGNVFVTTHTAPNGVLMLSPSTPAYTQQTVGSGMNGPIGVAVDATGNVYVFDAQTVWAEFLVGGRYQQEQLFPADTSPFYSPNFGTAVDNFGNLYSTNQTNGAVNELALSSLPALSGGATTLGVPALSTPETFGVMALGNAPLTLGAVKFPVDFPAETTVALPSGFPPNTSPTGECAGGLTLTLGQFCTLSFNFVPVSSLNGQNSQDLNEQIEVDTNSRSGNENAEFLSLSGTELRPQSKVVLTTTADPITVGQSVTLTATVPGTAVGPTGTMTFYQITSTSPYAMATVAVVAMTSGQASYSITGLAAGNYSYFATYSGDSNYQTATSSTIIESVVVPPGTLDFGNSDLGTVNVNASGPATLLTVKFAAAETLGGVGVLTQGTPNLDFTDAGGGTCVAGQAYTAGETCTVNVAFKPHFPGPRYGAVVLSDIGGNIIGTGYLQGTGVGAMAGFLPGTTSSLSNVPPGPKGMAIDGSGNIFVADGWLYELTPANGSYTQSVIAKNFVNAYDVAVDGSGTLYVGDLSGSGGIGVYKLSPAAGGYAQTAIGYGFESPQGIAVDGLGNVYVADNGANSNGGAVVKLTPANGSYTQSVAGGPWGNPTDVAVDGAGNLYVTDDGMLGVYKETLSGGAYSKSAIAGPWKRPLSVSVDAGGNLLIVDNDILGDGGVYSERLQADGSYVEAAFATGQTYPNAITTDPAGNVFVSGGVGNLITKVAVADPPTLTFATTVKGQTSSDSPRVVSVTNNGNAALSFTAVTYPADFPEASGAQTDCSTAAVAPGASCSLSIDFTPLAAGTPNTQAILSEVVTLAGPQWTSPVTVAVSGTESIPANPTLGIAGSAVSVAPGAATGNTSTITLTPGGGFTGAVALSAVVTTSPPNAQYSPTLSFGATSSVTISSASAVTATLTISTTAASAASVRFPRGRGVRWSGTGAGVLACLIVILVPRRRRGWVVRLSIAMLGVFVMCVASCGGGGSGSGGGGIGGTTPGSYTITVTGTSGTLSSTGTVALTVQ